MQLTTTALVAAAGLASLVAADHTAKFVNKEGVTRHVSCTPSSGNAAIPSLTVGPNGEATASFPHAWQGNCWSYKDGQPAKEGLLAEFSFDGNAGFNFFDISAIVSPGTNDGTITIEPAQSHSPLAGCTYSPCGPVEQYNDPNDNQATKSTKETDFIVTLGQRTPQGRRARRGINYEFVSE